MAKVLIEFEYNAAIVTQINQLLENQQRLINSIGQTSKANSVSVDGLAKSLEDFANNSAKAIEDNLNKQLDDMGKKLDASNEKIIELVETQKEQAKQQGALATGANAAMNAFSKLSGSLVGARAAAFVFGNQSKSMGETLTKLIGIVTALNALKQVSTALNYKEAVSVVTLQRQRLIDNAQIAINTGLQSSNVVVTKLATAAQWALNAAMMANPFVAIAAALIAIGTALFVFAKRSAEAEKETERFNKAQERLNAIFDAGKKAVLEHTTVIGSLQKAYRNSEGDMVARERVIARLNKEYGELVGGIRNAADAEKFFATQSSQVIRIFEAKAKAAALYNQIVELQNEIIEANRNREISNSERAEIVNRNTKLFKDYVIIYQNVTAEIIKAEDALKGATGTSLKETLEKRREELQDMLNKMSEPTSAEAKKIKAEIIQIDKQLEQWNVKSTESVKKTTKEVKRLNDELKALKTFGMIEAKDVFSDKELADIQRRMSEVTDIIRRVQKEQEDSQLAEQQRLSDRQQAINNAAVSSAQSTADAVFQIWDNQRQATEEGELARLDRIKDGILKNDKLTAEQREAIELRYEAKKRSIQREGARKAKQAALLQAGINTALAVTSALATVQPTVPAGVAAAIAAGVAGAAQIAVIASKPLPAYEQGTNYAKGGLSLVGERGPELVELPTGAKVKTARQTRELLPKAGIGIGSLKSVQQSHIDYDKLGSVIAEKMPEPVYVSMNADADGLSTMVQRRNLKQTIRNKRYSLSA